MSRQKLIDLFVLVFIEIFASALSLLFGLTFLYSTLLFLGVPCAYLFLRMQRPSQWLRIFAMATLFGGWYGFLFAYLADWNRIWAWPAESLPWGVWFYLVNPVELLWVFLWVLFIVLFYEHFVEHDTQKTVSIHIMWAILSASLTTLAITLLTVFYPTTLDWRYAYAVLLLLNLPTFGILLYRNPRIIKKLILPTFFFVPMHFLHEITSLLLGQWYFPGEYIALITLPFKTAVPLEEFILWILLGSVLTLAYYELYIDDEK